MDEGKYQKAEIRQKIYIKKVRIYTTPLQISLCVIQELQSEEEEEEEEEEDMHAKPIHNNTYTCIDRQTNMYVLSNRVCVLGGYVSENLPWVMCGKWKYLCMYNGGYF